MRTLRNIFRKDRTQFGHRWRWIKQDALRSGPLWPHWRSMSDNCVRVYPPNKGTTHWFVAVHDDPREIPPPQDRYELTDGHAVEMRAFVLAESLRTQHRRGALRDYYKEV